MNRARSSHRPHTVVALAAILCLAASAWGSEPQARPTKPARNPRPTVGPLLRPTPTPSPLPDLQPWFTFDRVRQSSRADGTPCGIWNISPGVVNYNLVETQAGFDMILERRKGAGGTFEEACPDCTFHIAPLGGGVAGGGDVRQFNDCGYGPPYSPDFRIRVDIHNTVKESNERNNSQVRHFPIAS